MWTILVFVRYDRSVLTKFFETCMQRLETVQNEFLRIVSPYVFSMVVKYEKLYLIHCDITFNNL